MLDSFRICFIAKYTQSASIEQSWTGGLLRPCSWHYFWGFTPPPPSAQIFGELAQKTGRIWPGLRMNSSIPAYTIVLYVHTFVYNLN